ncbi:MAG: M20 family metallopeptidase [Candidatus Accumulibacter sp.]|jgi:succinyl-diaminopimelate desuccinylase|nr:M20 family metallopeptidase [Accumulibacter sp.]
MDTVELLQHLVRMDTCAAGERQALRFLADLLEPAGFSCHFEDYLPADRRMDACNLYAVLNEGAKGEALFFGGHIDTVPVAASSWSIPPFAAEIRGDRLYGRGAVDMKSGLAAFVSAALEAAPLIEDRELILHIYGGEEHGCLGSRVAKKAIAASSAAVAIIAEPTNARPLVGHRGAFWLDLRTRGVAAHASMPEKGENALAKMLPVANRLLDYRLPDVSHPYLGTGTFVVSTLHAGINSNSVPDSALLTIDIRTVPGQKSVEILGDIENIVRNEAALEVTVDLEPVWTDPELPWVKRVRGICGDLLGDTVGIETVAFFTDAASVRQTLGGIPIVILGPGEPALAHKVDEWCSITQLLTVEKMYARIIRDWYQGQISEDSD